MSRLKRNVDGIPARDGEVVYVSFKTTAEFRRNLRYLALGSGLTVPEVLNRILEVTFEKNRDFLDYCRRCEEDNPLVL